MIRARSTATINRPASDVFAFFADGTNNTRWRAGVLEISKMSGDGLGATYRQVLRGPGRRRVPGDYRVSVFQPPEKLVFDVVAGPARPRGTFEVRATGPDKTFVTFSLEIAPKGLMRLMWPVISRQARREVAALEQAKTVLEQS